MERLDQHLRLAARKFGGHPVLHELLLQRTVGFLQRALALRVIQLATARPALLPSAID